MFSGNQERQTWGVILPNTVRRTITGKCVQYAFI